MSQVEFRGRRTKTAAVQRCQFNQPTRGRTPNNRAVLQYCSTLQDFYSYSTVLYGYELAKLLAGARAPDAPWHTFREPLVYPL